MPRSSDRRHHGPKTTDLHRSGLLLALPLLASLLAACGGGTPGADSPTVPDSPELRPIPVFGTDATLELGTWNLEWFGDPGNGPDDEARQLARAAHVLRGLDVDLWSVQEVVDPVHFRALLDSLPGYGGFLANDPSVVDGPAYYSGFGGNELKVGLVYKTALVRVESARVVLTGEDHAFAGRPPVEVRLTTSVGGVEEPLVVFLLHAKAGPDPDDRDRRERGAEALKAYLDDTWPDARVAVLGDFNDDVDVSIEEGAPSPYLAFVRDADDYRFLTAGLSEADATSTVFWDDVIDHHLATDEVVADYVEGSALIVRADEYVPEYGETTSDHYPVVTRLRAGG